MKKFRLLSSILAIVLVMGIASGCDNRSQMEKDADAAAKKLNKAIK